MMIGASFISVQICIEIIIIIIFFLSTIREAIGEEQTVSKVLWPSRSLDLSL